MLHQFLAFSMLHIKQLKRSMDGLGIFRFLVVLFIVGGGLLALFTFLSAGENLEVAVGLFLTWLFFIQIQRKDLTFLKINFDNYRRILASQYLVLSLPFLPFLFFFFKWFLILITFALIAALPFVNFKIRHVNLNTKMQQWIPDTAFEWKAGVRKFLFLIIATWVGGMIFSFFTGAIPLALFILGMIPLKFYENGEPLVMLLAPEKSPAKLIFNKFKWHVLLFTLISLPLMLIFLIFHLELWYIVMAEFVIFLSLHFYFLLLKYAWYRPMQKAGGVEVFSSIGAVGMVLPVLLPIVWLLTIRFYFKALANLKHYLHDFD